MAVGRRLVEPAGQPRQLGDEHHPDGDGLAVPPAVALAPLDRVPEGVAVVEGLRPTGADGARAGPRDHPGLHRMARATSSGSTGRGSGGRRVGLDQVQDHRVRDEPALDDLGQTGGESCG